MLGRNGLAMLRLRAALAVLAVALVAGCRDSVPTERAIQVHAPAAHICFTDRSGPASCACQQFMYDHPGDPLPQLCFLDSAQVVLSSDHGPGPSISVNAGDTVVFFATTNVAAFTFSVTGYSFVPLPPMAMANRMPSRGGVLPAIRATPARIDSAASVTRGRSVISAPGRSAQLLPGVTSCRTSTDSVCFDVFTTSGYEIISATVDGVSERDSLLVIVAPPPSTLQVTCSPAAPVRTTTVTCSAAMSDGSAFVPMRRTSTSQGITLVDSIFAGGVAVTRDDWTGLAIVTTSVTYTGTAQNLPVTATGSFTVATRIGQSAAWADSSFGFFPATPPSPAFLGGAPLRDSYPGIHPRADGYDANEGALGETFFQYPGDINIAKLGGVGPNRGVRFILSVPWGTLSEAGGLPAGVYVEQSMQSTDPFYQRQVGPPPNCTQADLGNLSALILRHENLHWTEARRRTLPLHTQATIEGLTELPNAPGTLNISAKAATDAYGAAIAAANDDVEHNLLPVKANSPVCNMVP